MALDPGRQYEIVFRGELLPGYALESVKPRLLQLFSASPEQIQALFSGRRTVIKTSLDLDTAQKYQQTLEKTGLYVEVNPLPKKNELPGSTAVPVSESTASAPSAPAPSTTESWTLMQVGCLLSDPVLPVVSSVKAPDFTLAEPGVVLGELPRHAPPVQVSIAHLSVLPLN